MSESGRQIGEKLFVLLNTEQRKELIHYIFARNKQNSSYADNLPSVLNVSDLQSDYAKPFTPDAPEYVVSVCGEGAVINLMLKYDR